MARKKQAVEVSESVAAVSEAIEEVKVSFTYDYAIPVAPKLITYIQQDPYNATSKGWSDCVSKYVKVLEERLKELRGEQFAHFAPIVIWAKGLVSEADQKNIAASDDNTVVNMKNAVGIISETMDSFVQNFSGGLFTGRQKGEKAQAKVKGAKQKIVGNVPERLYDFLGAQSAKRGLKSEIGFKTEKIAGKFHISGVATDNSGKMAKFADTLFNALEMAALQEDTKSIRLIASQAQFTSISPAILASLVHSALVARELKTWRTKAKNAEADFVTFRTQEAQAKAFTAGR